MDVVIPLVDLHELPAAELVSLDLDDPDLIRIGKEGIVDSETGQRRGPLALDLAQLHAIRDYFATKGRKPTDIEIESLAQTWSEHCKHTIFASPLEDDMPKGLYKTCIQAATNRIRQERGEKDICLSVFSDNSGGIIFDDQYLVTHKVETHNSPSALDPFGGALTGIVGVNRDTIGFGLGAKPCINIYGFCVGDPEKIPALFRGKDKSNPILSPRRILDGVVPVSRLPRDLFGLMTGMWVNLWFLPEQSVLCQELMVPGTFMRNRHSRAIILLWSGAGLEKTGFMEQRSHPKHLIREVRLLPCRLGIQ